MAKKPGRKGKPRQTYGGATAFPFGANAPAKKGSKRRKPAGGGS